MQTIISTHGLVKRFGRANALDGLDLAVRQGEIHGFLGPNGSGKSTTIRILLGLTKASAGSVQVLGEDPWRSAPELHRHLAYVPGDVNLWPNFTGGASIDLISRLRRGRARRADPADYQERRKRLIDAFEFDPRKKGRAYSKGNRQKVALIAAFATPADLYIFDEPTSGLDPLMEEVFQSEVHRVHDTGATVLLSSHILSEVEQLCDQVSIIRSGRIVDSGSLADLRHLTRTKVSFSAVDIDVDGVRAIPAAHDVAVTHGTITFGVDSDAVDAVLPELARLQVTDLRIAPPSLEELFLRHYGAAAGGSADRETGSAESRR